MVRREAIYAAVLSMIRASSSTPMNEIPCIHAECYPAGELKNRPLALANSDTRVNIAAFNGCCRS